MTVKLFNRGKREIQLSAGSFHPQTMVTVSAEEAKKIKRLYPQEVDNLEDASKAFQDDAETKKGPGRPPKASEEPNV